MIASLPMYDRPELAAAHDALWSGIAGALREEGIDAPVRLDRDIPIGDGWRSPELLLGQICGLPLRAGLHDRLEIVATLDYGLDETPPGHYRSLFVTRRGDATDLAAYADRRFALNEGLSHSGWAAAWSASAARGFHFRCHILSGSHRASARLVANGGADIASIDAVAWRAIERFEPEIAQALQIIDRSPPSLGLPLVTARGRDTALLVRAVKSGVVALEHGHAAALGLCGIVEIPLAAYLAEPIPPAPADVREAKESPAI